MKFARSIALAAGALALACSGAYADTKSSEKDKTTMEQQGSPSTRGKQTEERTHSHSQPDVPTPGGTTSRNVSKGDPQSSTDNLQKQDGKKSAAAGATKPSGDAMDAFSSFDTDGDGMISKAEAAGNADLMNKFDRADKNRDGKLSRQEFANMNKPATEKKQKRAKSESSSR